MKVTGLRGVICAVSLGWLATGCLTEADGVEVEDVGEVSSALCSTTKVLKASKATSNLKAFHPENAIDGDLMSVARLTTLDRLVVDYGKINVVSQVQLEWRVPARTYEVAVSLDGSTYTTIKSLEAAGKSVKITGINQKVRYIRLKNGSFKEGEPVPELIELIARGDTTANCLKADGEACTSVSECANERCGLWYKDDADGDNAGITPTASKVCGLVAPAGYLSRSKDCCDIDPITFPGQSQGQSVINACGSWDHDCSGSIFQAVSWVGQATCDYATKSCDWDSGWIGSVPACGKTGSHIFACSWQEVTPGGPSCQVLVSPTKMQTCR